MIRGLEGFTAGVCGLKLKGREQYYPPDGGANRTWKFREVPAPDSEGGKARCRQCDDQPENTVDHRVAECLVWT